MEITIKFECENAAFDGAAQYEIARILRDLAATIERRPLRESQPIRDLNGNLIGEMEIEQ